MTKKRKPSLPSLLKSKIYKTGQTRGADDDVIFQNRVNRNSTVLIPYNFFEICNPEQCDIEPFENGFIVLINPEYYFNNEDINNELIAKGLKLGENALIFYETRREWNLYNPIEKGLNVPNSRKSPLGGEFVARVPSTTSADVEKVTLGYNTSGLKGAGIRVYEYASKETFNDAQYQLEYLFWLCTDSNEVALSAGMSSEDIELRLNYINEICEERNLKDYDILINNRIIDKDLNTICPLCLQKLSGKGFINRLTQAEGRLVPDLTVTEINLFHIIELRTGQYNHRPYNLGWGHHHCNVVCKDSGISETLRWIKSIYERNLEERFEY
ncbi:BstXI family restriction endonuclease [Chryseobacterium sp. sg2396]|uniref:BstXI family restriction endonuclease n=1 Tax=Chryseobacterium sp. sg2396 TaxID=3276280 RepID=UPI00366D38D0